jgi:hypothetical protein
MLTAEPPKLPAKAHGVLPWIDSVLREDLHQAMIESEHPGALKFCEMLGNPRFMDLPLSVLANRCGMKSKDLMEIWRDRQKTAALGEALRSAPQVARDMSEDAKSVEVCCPRCDGGGSMRIEDGMGLVWIKCKQCKGSGLVRRPGDLKSREWVMRNAGVISAEPSGVAVSVNVRADSVLDEMERLDEMDRRTVDVTLDRGEGGIDG